MAYLTYQEYQGYGGTLTSTAFDRFEFGAEKHIDRLTHGRIISEAPVRLSVKRLTFEIVEYLRSVSDVSGAFASASNEGASVTYATQAQQRAYIRGLALDYLDNEKTADGVYVLYAGVDS